MVPVAVPALVGLKTTLTVQLAFDGRLVPQVPVPPKANGPLIVKVPEKSSVAPPELVTVAYLMALERLGLVDEKVREAGAMPTTGVLGGVELTGGVVEPVLLVCWYAPMSMGPPCGRALPSKSVLGAPVAVPAPIAGLVVRR